MWAVLTCRHHSASFVTDSDRCGWWNRIVLSWAEVCISRISIALRRFPDSQICTKHQLKFVCELYPVKQTVWFSDAVEFV